MEIILLPARRALGNPAARPIPSITNHPTFTKIDEKREFFA